MHLIIPYASGLSDACLAAQASLKLPHLQKLLDRCHPSPPDAGDALSLSPPHERALARALGLGLADGQIAWAALRAREHPQLPDGGAWAFITLCHWQVHTHHIAMSHLPLPELTQAESAALLAAMRPYFEEDGIALFDDQPGRWLAQAEVFADLASAAPDRVAGRNLAHWMPGSVKAAPLRRLQNEMQMLLYTHPVNDARQARGVAPVNSFWLSGTGALPSGYRMPDASAQPTLVNTLRAAALADDWLAWVQAWQTLDAAEIRLMLQYLADGQPVQLTLCGERSSQCWHGQKLSAWQSFKHLFASRPLSTVLEQL